MKFLFKITTTYFYLLTVMVLAILFGVYFYNTQSVKTSNDLVEHTQDILFKSNTVLLSIMDIETDTRGFILTGNESFLASYANAEITAKVRLMELQRLTKDSQDQQIRLVSLKKKVNQKLALAEQFIVLRRGDNQNNEVFDFVKGKKITDSIRTIIAQINNTETLLLKQRKIDNGKIADVSDRLLGLLFALLLVITILVFFILKSQKKRSMELAAFNDELNAASKYTLSLIEASRDPMFTISPEGKITDTNDASVRVTGIAKEELIGSSFIHYFTEPDKAKQSYETVFLNGFLSNFPLTIKDHKLTDVLFNGSVYKDENNVVIGAVVVAHDITLQKALENELTQAKVFAEKATAIAVESVKSKQQFLSNMSHEIRTPMNAIIGFTKVILKTELTAKQKEYLMAIKMSGDSLIVLINDILDLAKVDAGKMIFEKTPFKLKLSINAMLHLFEIKIQEKNLRLITNYDNRIPEVLIGDPVRLHQIILNLVSNAVKFTNNGNITVTVFLVSENEESVTVKFSIADTGIGIKNTKTDTIFENFQQATSGTSRLFGGTGLGLAIVKQLIEAQKGTIQVESELNKGSTFSFSLDFHKTNIETILEPEIQELNTDIKDIKILVVEDMELNQLLMKTLLDDFGFECEIAANGKIAIEKLQSKTFDIILMDLQMPEMNGFEATHYIRETMQLDIPIIALTADVTTVDVEKCKAVGMNDYIAKPVDERLLYSKLISCIKKPVLVIEQIQEASAIIEKVKYIDMAYLLKLTKSNPKLMTEMIGVYLKQTPILVESMKKSFSDKDWQLLQATIHKIIPSFAIMGLNPKITEMAKKIQEFAHQLEVSDDLNQWITQLESICKQTFVELEIELSNLNKE